jgi:anti-anti-sigma factor
MLGPTKVFQVVQDGDLVVVIPQGAARDFQYRQVHMEANAVLRLVSESKTRNVVVDLEKLDFVDSVMIESILRVLTVARKRGGCAGFCNVSDNLVAVLAAVRLGEVWQRFGTRAEAVATIRQAPDYS